MYRRLLAKAIGTGTSELNYLLMEHSRIFAIPGGAFKAVHYCPIQNITYVEISDKKCEGGSAHRSVKDAK